MHIPLDIPGLSQSDLIQEDLLSQNAVKKISNKLKVVDLGFKLMYWTELDLPCLMP